MSPLRVEIRQSLKLACRMTYAESSTDGWPKWNVHPALIALQGEMARCTVGHVMLDMHAGSPEKDDIANRRFSRHSPGICG
jgi:hypothetical protein